MHHCVVDAVLTADEVLGNQRPVITAAIARRLDSLNPIFGEASDAFGVIPNALTRAGNLSFKGLLCI